ncbi:MAG: GTPase HflX [Streptococcaceae bacterium]|nr:GTPase HflX [Streptococcaceae bacterium]
MEKERIILVGVRNRNNEETFDESMIELKNLAKTAQGEVVNELTQNLQEIDRRTVIGKGKMEELLELVDTYEADVVIFNHELSPRQANNIAEVVGVKVIDRIQLILDIFAMRAQSKEGKLQVELAQLNYLSQRLSGGYGLAMSRQRGGIGTRGPGETKLESDRRHIRYRISLIKKELKQVEAHRERQREKRKQSKVFQIGLIGYTNAGKSTLLNLMTAAQTYEEDQLFATLDPLTKKWRLPTGMNVTLTDTVGFIQDLPTQLIESFQSTLEESRGVDLLLHVVDASNSNRQQHEKTVLGLLNDLQMEHIPMLTVYNKADKLIGDFHGTLYPNVLISAKEASSKDILTDNLIHAMMEVMTPYDFDLATSQSKELYALKNETLLLSEEYDEEKNIYHVKGFARNDSIWASWQEKTEEEEF